MNLSFEYRRPSFPAVEPASSGLGKTFSPLTLVGAARLGVDDTLEATLASKKVSRYSL